ncbi:MAG: carbonic anhydrase [Gallionellales bacterium RIFCSPLOWO2_12_FULL_59_22]|nr:MAG: carbonic anhydrase [Gallionellales bacterium RIFCSPLOWO2_02_FULL_59_110]OGT04143.1 MAG: carbonic anhydrase [Gallionellales bacterium RIFCSPLOWO2_02_58_13]OGT10115.1 MAG: carbonic anhydrase [Gallionellales bacterium RIFCSPLOWO2_12_FULL_59_22]
MSSPGQLIEGFSRFRRRHYARDGALFHELVERGQMPEILVVACCDARVDPALVLDCAPGDLFVIRNVANLVPPAENQGHYHGTSAALEFGVRKLNVGHIIVLGHAHCGGIHALLEGDTHKEAAFIAEWMGIAAAAREQVNREFPDAGSVARQRACEQQAILVSLANLMTFPWIRERVEQATLALHGWYFDIERGELLGYNAATRRFEML